MTAERFRILALESTCRSSTISPSVSVPSCRCRDIHTAESSIAASCFTRTFFRVMRFAPWASVTVMIMASFQASSRRQARRRKERLQHRTMKNDVHEQDEKNEQHGTHVSIIPKWRTPRPNSVSVAAWQTMRNLTAGGIFPVQTMTAVPIPV